MQRRNGKNGWALFLLMLAGIVLGGFIGWLAKDVSFLSWLNYGRSFGLDSPLELDLGIIFISFKLLIDISVGSIIGIMIAFFVYRKI